MPWGQFPRVKFGRSRRYLAGSRYAIISALYSKFGARCANLTSARPVRSNRPRAQVVELVDALASGASGLTAVKVRALSWPPFSPKHVIQLHPAPLTPPLSFTPCPPPRTAPRTLQSPPPHT